jgi:homoaconitase/3-isopropylmalate dehydratase large subunit
LAIQYVSKFNQFKPAASSETNEGPYISMAFGLGASRAESFVIRPNVWQRRTQVMRFMTAGLVVTVVFLAVYFVSTMERVW